MQARFIQDKKEWNEKALMCAGSSYLQSWEWGDALIGSGQKVERILFGDENNFAVAQIIFKKLPFGRHYFFCPKGPLFFGEGARHKILDEIFEYFKSRRAVFFRFEPNENFLSDNLKILKTKEINPSATLVLDISQSEEKLLSDMRQKARYNLRVAQRSGLSADYKKDFESFWSLLKKTGDRDGFVLHPRRSYMSVMGSDAVDQITIRDSGGEAIASGGFIGFGETYYYLYGALDYDKRDLMAPYLLQWSAILNARKLGYKYYDFFGIAPGEYKDLQYIYDESHQYAGITKFKLGFGGIARQSPGTFDLIIFKFEYNIYKLGRALRRII
jgi:lipid II:glycine glycyltransferase (peptidoglycan interpeptide bridge formation enzyme)